MRFKTAKKKSMSRALLDLYFTFFDSLLDCLSFLFHSLFWLVLCIAAVVDVLLEQGERPISDTRTERCSMLRERERQR